MTFIFPKHIPLKLLPIEILTLIYIGLTTLYTLIYFDAMPIARDLLLHRLSWITLMAVAYKADQYFQHNATHFIRSFLPLIMLGYWYPETYYYSSIHPNMDHLFALTDEKIFGCQPSIVFSKIFPQHIASELFYMGYFSYYPMIFITCLLPLFSFKQKFNLKIEKFERIAFIVVSSFYLYYLLYDLIPVAGPQFYFPVIGLDNAVQGIFDPIYTYFAQHTTLTPFHSSNGFFQSLVEQAQSAGEMPTAAFPSSHVGISTVLMLLLYEQKRWIAYAILPCYLLLCGATVYIGAHYCIDSIAGFLSALLFFHFTNRLYRKMTTYHLSTINS